MINLWATWCGPCESEFPYMQEAYEKYKDDVEIIALSVEKSDTDEVLKEYADKHKMTFPVGSDSTGWLGEKYASASIPATLLIDRFGTVVYYGEGAVKNTEEFTGLFDQVIGDDYKESVVIKDAAVTVKPNVERLDSQTLSITANAEGGSLVFENVEDEFVWPMAVREADGRTILASTNKGVQGSKSEVRTNVDANKGDVLAFDFHISSQPAIDVLEVVVDGKVKKTLSGEHDWTTWGIPLDEGTHEIIFRYDKPYNTNEGDDEVLLDNIKLVSGDEAQKFLASLPTHPTADKLDIEVTTEGAREIIFSVKGKKEPDDGKDVTGYDVNKYYIVPGNEADIRFTLTEDIDPDAAHGYDLFNYKYIPVTSMETDGNAYITKIAISSSDTDGNCFNEYVVFPMEEGRMFEREEHDKEQSVIIFANEDEVAKFIKQQEDDGFSVLTWRYKNGNK